MINHLTSTLTPDDQPELTFHFPSRSFSSSCNSPCCYNDSMKTVTNRSTCSPPSDETNMESLRGEPDVWMCGICRHLNSGARGICGLCWGERSAFVDIVEPSDDDFSSVLSPSPLFSQPLDNTPLSSSPRPTIKIPTTSTADFTSHFTNFSSPSHIPDENAAPECSGKSMCSYNCSSPANDSPPYGNSGPPGSSPFSSSASYSYSQYSGTTGEGVSSKSNPSCHILLESVDSSVDEEEEDSLVFNLPNEVGPFTCPHPGCQLVMQDSMSLHVHEEQHKWGPHRVVMDENGSQKFLCCFPGCNQLLDDKKNLKKHVLNHREKVFACHYPNCDRKFYERAKLKRHFLVHTGEKPFVCPFENCGKKFGYNANLKTHLRTHTGSRPFPCTVPNCRRRFAQASNRNIHVLTHERGGEDVKQYVGEPSEERRVKKINKPRREYSQFS